MVNRQQRLFQILIKTQTGPENRKNSKCNQSQKKTLESSIINFRLSNLFQNLNQSSSLSRGVCMNESGVEPFIYLHNHNIFELWTVVTMVQTPSRKLSCDFSIHPRVLWFRPFLRKAYSRQNLHEMDV